MKKIGARTMEKKIQKIDDPLKQYVILDPKDMKTPPGRWVFVPVDTEDTANRMCWAIALAAYADALSVFGRKKQAMSVMQLAAEMANDTKIKHPELFIKQEKQDAKGKRSSKASPSMGKTGRNSGKGRMDDNSRATMGKSKK